MSTEPASSPSLTRYATLAADIAQSDPDAYNLMTGPEGPYVFAGEHLSHVGAWQQGAFVSAWRAVNQIAEHRRATAA